VNFCLRSAASGPSAVRSRGRDRTEGGFLAAQRCSAVPGPFLDYPRGRCTLHRPSGGRIHVPTSVRTSVQGVVRVGQICVPEVMRALLAGAA
jgi:hypothetical protein